MDLELTDEQRLDRASRSTRCSTASGRRAEAVGRRERRAPAPGLGEPRRVRLALGGRRRRDSARSSCVWSHARSAAHLASVPFLGSAAVRLALAPVAARVAVASPQTGPAIARRARSSPGPAGRSRSRTPRASVTATRSRSPATKVAVEQRGAVDQLAVVAVARRRARARARGRRPLPASTVQPRAVAST